VADEETGAVRAATHPNVEIALLGPLEVVAAGVPVAVAGSRRRGILARLALVAPAPVRFERLAEDVFEDAPDRLSVASLRTYVTKLRQQLPTGSDLLRAGPGGLALAIPARAIDANRFAAAVAFPDEDPASTIANLREALDLWRGAALQEFSHLDWARPDATRLQELRLSAQDRLIDAHLATGRHDLVVATLRALVANHPLRERFHVQLVLALYRDGRHAEALDAQRAGVALLREELGLDPGVELAALEHRILVHDPSLAAPAPPRGGVPDAVRVGTRLPAPLLERPADGPFVGRVDELARLVACCDGITATGARVAVVRGEAGIGKTALTRQVAAHAAQRGAVVVYGRCDEHLAVPYQPVAEALRAFVRTEPPDTVVATLGADASALARLVPELATVVPGPAAAASGDPAVDQLRLYHAVSAWLGELARASPVVLVLDDIQWATGSTALLVRHVVRDLRDAPLLVLATLRDGEAGVDPLVVDALAAAARDGVVVDVALGGLDRAAASSLVATAVRAAAPSTGRRAVAPSAAVVDRLVAATGGNPYLLGEMARHGAIGGAGVGVDDVPPSVRQVLLARFRRLQPDAQDLLRLAAAAGHGFELDVVVAASGRSEDDVLAALDDAVAAGLVRELDGAVGTYEFAHAILHRTVVTSTSPTRLATLHQRIAAALERFPTEPVGVVPAATSPDVIGAHWRAAGPRFAGRAAVALTAAARRAAAQFADGDAARLLRSALDLLPADGPPAHRIELLLELAAAETRLGDAATARASLVAACALAREHGDPVRLARAALGTSRGGRGVSNWVADDLQTAMLEEAHASLPDNEVELRVRVAGQLSLALFRPEHRTRRQLLAREAVEAAERAGTPDALAAALPASRVRYWRTAEARARHDLARRVADAARVSDDVWAEVDALVAVRGDCQELGDRAGFDAAGARLRDLADRAGGVVLRWRAGVCDTHDAILDGRFDDAERGIAAALALWGHDPAPDAFQTYGFSLAVVRLLQGRYADVLELADQAADLQPEVSVIRAGRAYPLAALGHVDAARALVAECTADGLDAVSQDSTWGMATVLLAEAAAALEDRAAAETLLVALEPHADRFATVAETGVVWGSVGAQCGRLALVLGRCDDALAHLARAAELERAFGAHPWAARTEALLATVRAGR
jgi:DNA-binding SARP family transcriptional activator/tetratricopeptide (TPR) repeat protein